MAAWGGISSLQFGLSLFWSQAVRTPRRQLTVGKMNQLLCRAPARLAKLDHCKGQIRVGYDADLVVWSPHLSHTIKEDRSGYQNRASHMGIYSIIPYILMNKCPRNCQILNNIIIT